MFLSRSSPSHSLWLGSAGVPWCRPCRALSLDAFDNALHYTSRFRPRFTFTIALLLLPLTTTPRIAHHPTHIRAYNTPVVRQQTARPRAHNVSPAIEWQKDKASVVVERSSGERKKASDASDATDVFHRLQSVWRKTTPLRCQVHSFVNFKLTTRAITQHAHLLHKQTIPSPRPSGRPLESTQINVTPCYSHYRRRRKRIRPSPALATTNPRSAQLSTAWRT